MPIHLPNPELQSDFARYLLRARDEYLQEALLVSVGGLSIQDVDAELHRFAPPTALNAMASAGLRGELLLATPVLLSANPRLLAYYRLVLGYSQKEFYTTRTGAAKFKRMETQGEIPERLNGDLPELCQALCAAADYFIHSINPRGLRAAFLEQLAILTLGAQLRGGANVKKGEVGIQSVFDAIQEICAEFVIEGTTQQLRIQNSSRRVIQIDFSPDPDIVIHEMLNTKPARFRNIVAIEVKGGSDFSNIHNRIGEAEKSHLKARNKGFVECWTVVNVPQMVLETAHRESPTTNRFFQLAQIRGKSGRDYDEFRIHLSALLGLPTARDPV